MTARIALSVALLACACGEGASGNPIGTGESQTTLAGFAGGFVAVDGAALTIPSGSLRPDTTITVRSTTLAPPRGARTWSPVYQFEPEGLQFTGPVSVEIDVRGSGTSAVIVWSKAGGGYERLATQLAGGKAKASVTHFSLGFIADSSVAF
jgi:hypothetical protein